MTNNLMARLRHWQQYGPCRPSRYKEAADRIEKLEAALREIIDERGICGHCGQLATGEGKRSFVICDKTVLGFKGPCHWTPQDPKDIARKALGGKDD